MGTVETMGTMGTTRVAKVSIVAIVPYPLLSFSASQLARSARRLRVPQDLIDRGVAVEHVADGVFTHGTHA